MDEQQVLTVLLQIKEEQGKVAANLVTMEAYTKEKLDSIEAKCTHMEDRITTLETTNSVAVGSKVEKGKIWAGIITAATLIALFLAVPWEHIKTLWK